MLHKYLRPRFAWGAPWRKHRREGGERLQRQQGWHRRRLLTHQHPWGPPGDLPKDRVCCWVPALSNDNCLLSWRTQASEIRALPASPLLRDGWQQAGSASPPSPGSEVPTCPGSYLGPTPAHSSALQAPRERAPPSGPGVGAAPSPHPRRDHRSTSRSRLASGPGHPDVSPPPPRNPRGSRGARPHSHITHLPVLTIPHINNPSPPDTTSSPLHHPRKLSFLRPQIQWHPQGVKEKGVTTRFVRVPSRWFSSSSTSKVTWD